MIIGFCSPSANNSAQLHPWVQRYTYPLFEQSWNLFAPVPSANYSVFVNMGHPQHPDWIEVGTELIRQHRSHRFNGSEIPLLALMNTCYYIEKEHPAIPNVSVDGSVSTLVMEQFLSKQLKVSRPVQFMLLSETPITRQKRCYYANF